MLEFSKKKGDLNKNPLRLLFSSTLHALGTCVGNICTAKN
jgi:hypothetical protein